MTPWKTYGGDWKCWAPSDRWTASRKQIVSQTVNYMFTIAVIQRISSPPRRLVEPNIFTIHPIAQALRCCRGGPSTPRVFCRRNHCTCGHVPSCRHSCPDLVAIAALGHCWRRRRGTSESLQSPLDPFHLRAVIEERDVSAG